MLLAKRPVGSWQLRARRGKQAVGALSLAALAMLVNSHPARALPRAQASPRLDQIQLIGSHNSYHAGIAPERLAAIAKNDPALGALLDYRHASLTHQLDSGIRQIELDLYADEMGGRFANPHKPGALHIPWPLSAQDRAMMMQPGFKVMHIPDLDQGSTCQLLTVCLAEIRRWSSQHPNHAPVFVILETEKQNPIPGGTPVEAWSSRSFDALDRTLRKSLPASMLLTPDDVHKAGDSLGHAIATRGWPDLDHSRGRFVFLLDQRSDGTVYERGHPGLRGRVAFPNADPTDPDAAFTELNDGPADRVAALVRRHLLVRVRTDVNTVEGRTGAIARRDAFLASGAQILSTDYPDSEPARWSGYRVGFASGAPLRCNPVTAAPSCQDALLEPAGEDRLTLVRLVLVMRHGIRSALEGQQPAGIALPQDWPVWSGRPGDLTPHGAEALRAAGHSLREWLPDIFPAIPENGPLTTSGGHEDGGTGTTRHAIPAEYCPDAGAVALTANSEPRTVDSAQALAAGLAPGCSVNISHLPTHHADPLFSPLQTDASRFPMRSILAHMPVAQAIFDRENEALTLLRHILRCPERGCAFLDPPSRVVPDASGHGFALSGPIREGASAAEALELGYLDGKPLPELDGQDLTAARIETLSGLHAAMLDSIVRPPAIAAPLSQDLRQRLVTDLTESDGAALRIYMGHDDTIAPLLGMLGLEVKPPGLAMGEIPVGSALGFALYRNAQGDKAIRVVYFSQDPARLRIAPGLAPLSMAVLRPCDRPGGYCPLESVTGRLAP